MKTKTQRKAYLRRPASVYGGSIQKFLMPPSVLVFRELRRLELHDRHPQAPSLHHID